MRHMKKGCILLVVLLGLLFPVMNAGETVHAKEMPDPGAVYTEDAETGAWKLVGKPEGETATDYTDIEKGIEDRNYSFVESLKANKAAAADTAEVSFIPVGTEEELKNIANDMGGNYVLTADLVLGDTDWTAIGGNGGEFTGILDGNGHTISNLTSSKGNGLFFSIGPDAVIRNLTIAGTVTTTENEAAFLANTSKGAVLNCRTKGSVKQAGGVNAWSLAGMVNYNYGYMENCVNEAEVAETFGSLGSAYHYCFMGGIVSGNYGTMTGCENDAAITSDCMYAGGIAGVNSGNGLLEDCVNKGAVTTIHSTQSATVATGGITGTNWSGVIYHCVNEGSIKGVAEYNEIGGIAGNSTGFSAIIGCENRGSVAGKRMVGGICGSCSVMSGSTWDENDHLVIDEGRQILSDCINNAPVSGEGSSWLGGIVGQVTSGNGKVDILRCTNNGMVCNSGSGHCGGVTGSIDTSDTGAVNLEWLTNTGDVSFIDSGSYYVTAGGIFNSLNAEGIYAGTVSNCVNKGDVSAHTVFGIGPVKNVVLEQCSNFGAVQGVCCAGITTTYSDTNSTIRNSFNLGAITASSDASGIARYISATSVLENCYNAGSIARKQEAYGITSTANVINVISCYYLEQEFKGNQEQSGQVLTESAMQQPQSYAGFDFNGMWKMQTQNGISLPALHVIMNLEKVEIPDIKMETAGDTATVRPVTGTCINFVSANPSVCAVDFVGNVTSKKTGIAKVHAISEDGQVIDVRVIIGDAEEVPETPEVPEKTAQNLTATISKTEIAVGETASIKAAGVGEITYRSSDSGVVTVNGNGLVTGQGIGKAVITVSASGDDSYAPATAEISITVKAAQSPSVTAPEKAAQKLTASISKSQIAVGKTASIKADGVGEITYRSSDIGILTVNEAGLVTGKSVGTAVITVSAAGDGSFRPAEKKIQVTVTAPAKGTSFTDKSGKARYKITKAGSTVEYIKSTDSKATKITIPDTVKQHGVTYKVTSIAANAFKGNTKITNIVIGKNVAKLGTNAFSGCTRLTNVTIGSGVKTIGASAFSNCAKLKKITLPEKLTTIGDKAFYKCTSLTKVVIPSSVSKIGKQAFGGAKKLGTITIKTKKLTSQNVGSKAFSGISSKVTVKVPKSRLKAYKKLLKSRGIGSKAGFEKI